MTSTVVVLEMVLAALPHITTGVDKLIDWVKAVRQALQQSSEWTPELERKYRSTLWECTRNPAYQPDGAV